jgi:hypothetical protein
MFPLNETTILLDYKYEFISIIERIKTQRPGEKVRISHNFDYSPKLAWQLTLARIDMWTLGLISTVPIYKVLDFLFFACAYSSVKYSLYKNLIPQITIIISLSNSHCSIGLIYTSHCMWEI